MGDRLAMTRTIQWTRQRQGIEEGKRERERGILLIGRFVWTRLQQLPGTWTWRRVRVRVQELANDEDKANEHSANALLYSYKGRKRGKENGCCCWTAEQEKTATGRQLLRRHRNCCCCCCCCKHRVAVDDRQSTTTTTQRQRRWPCPTNLCSTRARDFFSFW